MRKEFEITEDQVKTLLDAGKSTPAMYLSGGRPIFGTPQENANAAWCELGRELGFDGMSVRPIPGKGYRFFTAEVVEIKDQ